MRNMKEANSAAFDYIITEHLKIHFTTLSDIGINYIKTNREEKEWLKYASIKRVLDITPEIKIIELEFFEDKYIAVVGTQQNDRKFIDSNYFEQFEVNAGLFTLLLSQKLLRFSKGHNPLEFYNNILFQNKEDSYKGHDFLEIDEFIENLLCFRIKFENYNPNNLLERFACYYFCIYEENLILNFESETLEFISALSLIGNNKINYSLIIYSLFSTHYKHSFLELYRLVERLMPVSYLKEFYTTSKSELNFIEFTSLLEDVTNWRPKEDQALEKIFDESKSSTISYFVEFKKSLDDGSPEFQKYFYKLRNSIVHYRANHEEYKLNNKQWNKLIMCTLILIEEHYDKHKEIL